jgi:hypothetical protein
VAGDAAVVATVVVPIVTLAVVPVVTRVAVVVGGRTARSITDAGVEHMTKR